MSNPDRIAEHHKKWDALPPFPAWPYVMTDDDIESWSDLIYLRALADDLEDHAFTLAARPEIGVHVVATTRLLNAADLVHVATALMPVPAAVTEPWPVDLAAGMLGAWRLAPGPRPPHRPARPHRGGGVMRSHRGLHRATRHSRLRVVDVQRSVSKDILVAEVHAREPEITALAEAYESALRAAADWAVSA